MDNLTKSQRSHVMSTIRSRNTAPELRIKKLMQALNFRYQPKGIYGKPDFANRKEKIAVFIDGCFWHGCQIHYKTPTSNVDFWKRKVSTNIKHDRKVSYVLRVEGWRVIRIWEHSITALESKD